MGGIPLPARAMDARAASLRLGAGRALDRGIAAARRSSPLTQAFEGGLQAMLAPPG